MRIDARVVDHGVDRLTRGGLAPELLDRVRIAEVGLDEAVAAALESLPRGLGRGPVGAVVQQHRDAPPSQRRADCGADAARSPGNQNPAHASRPAVSWTPRPSL